ncbi:hypothetical protein ElyMa_007010500 [Elysia marginata]|uniref:Glycoside hydrolase 123 catalytic domain-containing protein n=1 Tax=Elysia marginata TaxID=1093978 RepID=A0AAV4JPL7_9GAST|nr:hypothetical protein ElyMa_007010500 [Elysia marginata]
MTEIFNLVEENAPEFLERISIAGHPEAEIYATGDLSISYEFFPNQNLEKKETLEVIAKRNRNNKLTTFYLCGQPEHPNTLTYSPAIESQMVPIIAMKYALEGYTRWAYCNWTDNPLKKPVFNYNQGDEYIVYPGKTGPISTIRWELFKEGLEDYKILSSMRRDGLLTLKDFEKILQLYTEPQDGRRKGVSDISNARNIMRIIFGTSKGVD